MEATMTHVTIYTTPTCPYCIAAKALLKGKGVTFSEISIEGDRSAAAALAGRTGRRTVPQIFVGALHCWVDSLKAVCPHAAATNWVQQAALHGFPKKSLRIAVPAL
jgi:glutaredoxin